MPTGDSILDLDQLLADFRGPLVGMVATWGAPWRDANELAEDTFAEAFLSQARFCGDPTSTEDVGRWLRGIAFYLFSAWRRRQGRFPHSLTDPDSMPEQPGQESDAHLEALLTAMARLPARLQAVLHMHYLEETGVHQVAALLGLTPKTVEGRLYRARKELRRLLLAETSSAETGGRS